MAKRRPKVKTYVAAAAYKLDDDGDGGVRLWQCQYWNEPTRTDVLADVFAREVPDWKHDPRYAGMKLEDAISEWEGTLYAAPEVSVLCCVATLKVHVE